MAHQFSGDNDLQIAGVPLEKLKIEDLAPSRDPVIAGDQVYAFLAGMQYWT